MTVKQKALLTFGVLDQEPLIPPQTASERRYALRDLIGKPVAIISDASLGGKSDGSIITERLLSISGEDLQTVDRKYLPPWTGYLPSRFVILSNELPSIFNWALDALQKLRARGRFEQPASSADAIRDREDLASPVGAFLRDKCMFRPDLEIAVETLYGVYRNWCEDNGRTAAHSATFGRDLRAAKPGHKVIRHRLSRERFYSGVALGTPWTDDEVSIASTGDTNCRANMKCTACDGFCWPTYKPQDFGLPPRKE